MLAGQLSDGGVVSSTVTVNEQFVVLPDASVAVQVTVVVPFGNVEPDGGVQDAVIPGQLSLDVAVKLTTAEHCPESVPVVMFAGQFRVGASLSFTVTVNEQLAEPSLLVAVQLTVVVPFGKALPDAGVQVTVGGAQPVVVVLNVTVAAH
jgi:hypothetical protein